MNSDDIPEVLGGELMQQGILVRRDAGRRRPTGKDGSVAEALPLLESFLEGPFHSATLDGTRPNPAHVGGQVPRSKDGAAAPHISNLNLSCYHLQDGKWQTVERRKPL